jgi:hypothetical protein
MPGIFAMACRTVSRLIGGSAAANQLFGLLVPSMVTARCWFSCMWSGSGPRARNVFVHHLDLFVDGRSCCL